MSVLMNTNSGRFKISKNTVEAIIKNEREKALHLKLWDWIQDLFKPEPETKAAAQAYLYDFCYPKGPEANGSSATNSFYIFQQLKSLAQEEHKSQFKVSLSEDSTINFFIGNYLISSQPVQPEERETLKLDIDARKLDIDASNDPDPIESGTDLSSYLVKKNISYVKDDSFTVGGVHKEYCSEAGLLKAIDATGRRDFVREELLAQYSKDTALEPYLSLQQPIDPIDVPSGLDKKYAYARVPCYSERVTSQELDLALPDLQPDEFAPIALQLFNMLRVFYENGLSHRDLHGHNLILRKLYRSGRLEIFLQAIDFGKSKFDGDFRDHRFTDIQYIFLKDATTLPETLKRNHLRSAQSEKQRKHYPLHGLLCKAGFLAKEADDYLAGIGTRLINRLKNAEDENAVDAAFTEARNEIQRLLSPRSIIPDATTRDLERRRVIGTEAAAIVVS